MLQARFDADDVAVVDVIGLAVDPDFGLAFADEPVFVAIVIMPVEMAGVDPFEYRGAGHIGPGWPIPGGHVRVERIDDGIVGWLGSWLVCLAHARFVGHRYE